MQPIALTRASQLIHVAETLERLGESPEKMLSKAKLPMWHQVVGVAEMPHRQIGLRQQSFGRLAKSFQRPGGVDQLAGAGERYGLHRNFLPTNQSVAFHAIDHLERTGVAKASRTVLGPAPFGGALEPLISSLARLWHTGIAIRRQSVAHRGTQDPSPGQAKPPADRPDLLRISRDCLSGIARFFPGRFGCCRRAARAFCLPGLLRDALSDEPRPTASVAPRPRRRVGRVPFFGAWRLMAGLWRFVLVTILEGHCREIVIRGGEHCRQGSGHRPSKMTWRPSSSV